MNKNKNKPPVNDFLLKLEIAQELGLLDKIEQNGWKSLTARESGRLGGIIAKRKKESKIKGNTDWSVFPLVFDIYFLQRLHSWEEYYISYWSSIC